MADIDGTDTPGRNVLLRAPRLTPTPIRVPALMTLAATVAPLAAYAVVFQTILYVSLPVRLRTRVAPLVTGLVGAGISVGAGLLFGFEQIGLVGGQVLTTVAWGLGAVILVSMVGMVMLSRDELRPQLADPRLAALSRGETFTQVFVRIPVFTALIEEAFFRGVLHSALIALYPTEVAVFLGAGLFGLWHIGPGLDQARAGRGRDGPGHGTRS